MHSFYYHNHQYFRECISKGVKKINSSSDIGIYYEKGKWKWGSEGMQNSMKKEDLSKY